jgi:hypothetical protein
VADRPGRHEDQTLLLADVGRKALRQVQWTAQMLLEKHMEAGRAHDTAELLATGVWTHDHPLMAPELAQLGLPVKVGVPPEERSLMDLYPQPRGREASVEYVPGPQLPPLLPRRHEVPPDGRQ